MLIFYFFTLQNYLKKVQNNEPNFTNADCILTLIIFIVKFNAKIQNALP